jgi:hypothetical protein
MPAGDLTVAVIRSTQEQIPAINLFFDLKDFLQMLGAEIVIRSTALSAIRVSTLTLAAR